MFHCNGWCFPWSISVKAGAHVCFRQVRAKPIFDLIAEHKVTHLCGAPIVLSVLLNAGPGGKEAAAPFRPLLRRRRPAARLGPEGDGRGGLRSHPPLRPNRNLRARRGQRLEGGMGRARRPDPVASESASGRALSRSRRSTCSIPGDAPAPADGKTMGEVMFRGNVVMKGYLKNKASTDKAFAGGWFPYGDLGIKHPDGYFQLRDRSKDIIISAARTSPRSRWRTCSLSIPASSSPPWSPGRTTNGARRQCAFVEMKPGQGVGGRAHRMVPGAACALQVPAECRLRRNPEDLDRQGAEIHPARAGETARPGSGLGPMRYDAWPRCCRALLMGVSHGGRAPVPRPAANRRPSGSTVCARRGVVTALAAC